MSTHNRHFYREIRKIISKLSPNIPSFKISPVIMLYKKPTTDYPFGRDVVLYFT